MHKVANSQNYAANSVFSCNCRDVSRSPIGFRKRSTGIAATESLDHLEHGREVLLSQPAPDPRAVELAGQPGEGERGACGARLLEAQHDVLEHVLELEQDRDVVVDHRLAL